MEHRSSPALVPCAALAAGAALVYAGFAVEAPGLLVALGSLGLALGRGAGHALSGLALGLFLGFAPRADSALVPLPDRPVEVVGVIVDHPRPLGADAWRSRLRLSVWSQLGRVQPLEREVWLELGGEGEPPVLGNTIRARGYWLPSQPLGNGLPARPGLPRLRVKSVQLLEVEAPPGPVARLSGALRRRLEASPALSGDSLGAAFARALVLGDPGRIPVRVRQSLARLGLAHALSVSGLHVGLVAGFALLAARRARPAIRLVLAGVLVALYVAAVGPLPPLLRSAGMAALAAAALLLERPPAAANALALVAAGLVAASPAVVGDLSFVLSLAATAGLVMGAPVLLSGWRRNDDGAGGPPAGLLARGLATTLAAQLATLPWTLPVFALFTPWSALANLVAAPWLAVLLVASLVAVAASAAVPALGTLAIPLLDALAAPAEALTAIPVSPWVAAPLYASPLVALLGAIAMGVALCRPRPGVPALLLVATIWAGGGWLASRDLEVPVEIAFLDVGQGDAILLRDGGRALLLDGGGSLGGGDFGGRVLLPVLARSGLVRLEGVIASHEDRDHCGGLADLAGLVAFREVAFAAPVAETSCGRSLAGAAPARRLSAGDQIELGRWRLTVLHPARDRSLAGNDGSLVIRAEAFGRRFLLTGDIEAAAERELVASETDLAADILKLAHHGSRSSSGETFLDRVDPRLALVSAGRRNAFGHPSPVVLERLRRRGTRLLRTDRDGAVVFRVTPDGRLHLALPGSPK